MIFYMEITRHNFLWLSKDLVKFSLYEAYLLQNYGVLPSAPVVYHTPSSQVGIP